MADLSSIVKLVAKIRTVFQASSSSSLPPSFDPQVLIRDTRRIQAVLKDAEEREISDHSVRLWLKELRDIHDEAENILDEYQYELLQAAAEGKISEVSIVLPAKRMRREVSDSMDTSSSRAFWCKMAGRIQNIQERLEEVSKGRDRLHLREEDGQRVSRNPMGRPPSSHLVEASKVHGRDVDLRKVVDMLSSEDCRISDLFLITIVGMGGLGKTTLAQLVYKEVRCQFQLAGWVSVSIDVDVTQLTRNVIEFFTTKKCELTELSALQEELQRQINGRRFLLVLDDVWTDKADIWTTFLLPLKCGQLGSAIITTTRSGQVARALNTTNIYHLDCLSKDDCWTVFKQHAFRGRDPGENEELVKIGRQIAAKCKGLPLAARSLGSQLSFEEDVQRWLGVLGSNIWEEDQDIIIPALKLSYTYLPTHLRRCFLYASVFPKDFSVKKDELVRLWMAQGFVQSRGGRDLEEMGIMYVDELLERSMLQNKPHDLLLDMHDPSVLGMHDPVLGMHDLMHDLAQFISEGEYCVMKLEEAFDVVEDTRHLSVVLPESTGTNGDTTPNMLQYPKVLKTLLVLRTGWIEDLPRAVDDMMLKLKFLRVLKLMCKIIVPQAIGNLKHLRYLELDTISPVPDSVCKLYHLQTLILGAHLFENRVLPRGIGRLRNLRYLRVFDVGKREHECGNVLIYNPINPVLPRGIGRLRSLRTLNEFRVGNREDECGVEELEHLIHLGGHLQICNLRDVVEPATARAANLESKTKIRTLTLQWLDEWEDSASAAPEQQMGVLENLRPHVRLTELIIYSYGGPAFPNWVGEPVFSKLVDVAIDACSRSTSLPSLGRLPSLKRLYINYCKAVRVVGREFSGGVAGPGFPVLEELSFRNMWGWEAWQGVEKGDFPHLRSLNLFSCLKLESMIPLYIFTALQELVLCNCDKLTSIQLQSSPAAAASCSLLPSSSFMGPPPLKVMNIFNCPQAHFSPEEEPLLLPGTLQVLEIGEDCPLLAAWCQADAGIRLSHIPGARVVTDESGRFSWFAQLSASSEGEGEDDP